MVDNWVAGPWLRTVGEHTIRVNLLGPLNSLIPVGTRFLLLAADDLGLVSETNESNNVAPDLAILSAKLFNSKTVEFTFQIAGNLEEEQFEVALFRSPDPFFDPSDPRVRLVAGPKPFPAFGDTDHFKLEEQLRLPRDTPFLHVVANPDDRIAEPWENNNSQFFGFEPDWDFVDFVIPTDNRGNREAVPLTQVILYATADDEAGAIDTLTNTTRSVRVSAHYLVGRQGHIIQLVPEKLRADHAFPSNSNSIGIELVDDCVRVGNDCKNVDGPGGGHRYDNSWATGIQLARAAFLVRRIAGKHGIHDANGTIVHLYNKTDPPPGPFERQAGSPAGIDRSVNGILGHGQVLKRTGSKDDPRIFDWPRFMNRVNLGIVYLLHSPANLLVTDPLGNQSGVDPDTGESLLEIPGSEFSGAGTEPHFIAMPFAADGAYTVQVIGTGFGSFELEAWGADVGANLTSTQIAGNTAPGAVATYGFDFSSQLAHVDTVGLFEPVKSTFFLKNSNTPGVADAIVRYGPKGVGWEPIVGDWDGNGTSTMGLFDPASSTFFLRNSNTPGVADAIVRFGPKGVGWEPIVGDWDGDGITTVGLFEPVNSTFFLKNSNAPGVADAIVRYGPKGTGWEPIVGDWDGDGVTTVGLFDPVNSTFFLRNSNSPGVADAIVRFGPKGVGWEPIVGDWDGDGITTVGLFEPVNSIFFLRNSNTPGMADLVFRFRT